MQTRPHEGQVLRISDLEVEALVTDGGRNRENNGDEFSIQEVRPDMGRLAGCYGYSRKDGSDQWTDCAGEPVTVELIKDAPKPYRVGKEDFFGAIVVAICEGNGITYLPQTSEFAEAVRDHAATEGCGEQWEKLALATLRHGRVNLYEFEQFIEDISKLDELCSDAYTKREEFYAKRRGG